MYNDIKHHPTLPCEKGQGERDKGTGLLSRLDRSKYNIITHGDWRILISRGRNRFHVMLCRKISSKRGISYLFICPICSHVPSRSIFPAYQKATNKNDRCLFSNKQRDEGPVPPSHSSVPDQNN